VARFTVNDPERRNPVSSALFQALNAELAALPSEIRAVVLTGAGQEAFASGADLGELSRVTSSGLGGDFGEVMEVALAAIEACRVPVVARIQGHCLGAGYQLALACDLRVAVDNARLGVPASRFSLLPGHRQHARMLQQLGVQVTRELMLTGRSFKGEEALRRGLADYICPAKDLDTTVDALVDDIIGGEPLTVRNSKRMINTLLDFDAAGRELDDDTIAELVRLTVECHTSQDIGEGLQAFFERRQPNFQGR